MPRYRVMTYTKAVLSTLDPENHPIRHQSPRLKESRSQPSPSPKASFSGPAVLAAELRSSPVALRNRDLYPHLRPHNRGQCPLPCLQLRSNRDQYLSPLRHCRMAQSMHATHQRAVLFLHLRRRRLALLPRRLRRRSQRSRRCTTLRDNRPAS
jgi:hypothetical protein